MAIAQSAAYPEYGELAAPVRFRFLRELLKKKIATLAIIYLIIFYSAGIFAPVVPGLKDPYATSLTIEDRNGAPSREHWFGQDSLGRDLFARTFYAARTTIIFTVIVIATGGLFLGVGLGLLAGYRGGWIDAGIMRVGEVLAGLPTLIIILAITAAFRTRLDDLSFWLRENTILGNDARTIVQFSIIIGATVPFAWVGTSRIVRSQVLALRESDFVAAAESMGAGTWRIVRYHLLPGVMPLVTVGLSAGMAGIAGAEVALSFLGLGISPPTASFGNMIAEGAGVRTFNQHPHLLLASSGPVIMFAFAWNLLGDALVDILEPRARKR